MKSVDLVEKGDFVSDIQEEIKFPIREAREMVKDLMPPNAFIYWMDFLFHIMLGWSSFFFCFKSELFSLGQWVCFLISTFAFSHVCENRSKLQTYKNMFLYFDIIIFRLVKTDRKKLFQFWRFPLLTHYLLER